MGYQQASTTVWWGRQTAWVGVRTTCWFISAFTLLLGSQVGARVAGVIRHPQLTAVKLWALAHLLVNGDSASLLLFGGLLVWAVLEVVIINNRTASRRLSKPTSLHCPGSSLQLRSHCSSTVSSAYLFMDARLPRSWLTPAIAREPAFPDSRTPHPQSAGCIGPGPHREVARAVAQVGYPPSRRREHSFESLARIVMGQQLSVKAAATIAQRVDETVGGALQPETCSPLTPDRLRAAGLSRQKIGYLQSLAEAVIAPATCRSKPCPSFR